MPPKPRRFDGAVNAPAFSLETVQRRQVLASSPHQGRSLADVAQTQLFADAVPSLAGLQEADIDAKRTRQAIAQRGLTSTGHMSVAGAPLGAVRNKPRQLAPPVEQAVEADVSKATDTLLQVSNEAPDGTELAEQELDSGSKTVLTVVMLGAVLSILLVAL